MSENHLCPKCEGTLSEKPAAPYPVLLQVTFGVSFVAFLLLQDRLVAHTGRWGLWGWSGSQLLLGVFLIRSRMRASRRIRYCIRCGLTVA
jgi:hypothetical protein